MGCDYYEEKYLQVVYEQNSEKHFTEISLEKLKGYFNEYLGSVDSDDPDFDFAVQEFYKRQLNVCSPNVTVFDNGQFINSTLEYKYKEILSNNLPKNIKLIKVTKEKRRTSR